MPRDFERKEEKRGYKREYYLQKNTNRHRLTTQQASRWPPFSEVSEMVAVTLDFSVILPILKRASSTYQDSNTPGRCRTILLLQ